MCIRDRFFIVECGIERFLCAMRVFDVRASSSSLGYTTLVPNFVSFATSIVTLAHGEKVSKSLELYQSNERLALFDMLHLTCGTNFLLLFVVLISSIHHHHPALLHRHALIVDRLLTFLVTFSTLILELSFSQSLSLHSCHIPSSG